MKRRGQGLRFSIFNLLFLVAVIVWPATVLEAKYSGGSGTVNDPYLISTAEDMNQIGHNQSDWNKHFKMTADVNLSAYSGTQFNRIGTDAGHLFSGVFDGNGKTICGFTYTAANSDYIGIFGRVNTAGRIENVSLIDVNAIGRDYVGGLVGYNEGTISNCNSTGNIADGNSSQYLGGLVGENTGNISNCYSIGTIASGDGAGYIGRLAGGNAGSINNCYSTGTTTSGDHSGGIGGLVGENVGNISNCYSMGTVASGDVSGDVGGLAGNNSGSISNCYSTSTVTCGKDSWSLGGLIGENYEGSISNCYFLTGSGPDNGYGKPLTDANMKQQSSFAGWDFVWETVNGPNDIWAICEGGSYPKLAWQFMPGDSDNDKDVDFVDFARTGLKWRQADSNLYCGGMDLTGNGWVDWGDLAIMCDHWLEGF
jgi:hypothetical protein